jgi:type II secretory pathway component PulF
MSSGRLRDALAAAATRETERFSRMASPGTFRLSIGYLGVVWFVLVNIVCFLMYYIVPKFRKIFEDFDTDLPELLVTWISILGNPTVYSFFALSSLMGLGAALLIEALVDYYGWEGMLERFGSRFRVRFAAPDMLRGLRWGVLARKPLDAVLQDMGDIPVPFLIRTGLHRAAGGIRQGEEPWQVLQEVGWVRREEAELLRCAQAAGNLPWALEALSQSISDRRGYRVEWWLQALHPVLVLSMAVIVAWFVIAMFLPLVKLLNDLS